MSSMLEQAIIDAEALREVALKNAEASVIEKYSTQIKEAVEEILNTTPLNEEEEEEKETEVVDKVDYAAASDDKDDDDDCPCPDEEQEEVVLDLTDLLDAMKNEKEEEGLDVSEMLDREEVAEEIVPEENETMDEEIEFDEAALESLLETEEETLEEEKKKMVKGPDGKMVPDYAADGKGPDDLLKKEETNEEKEETMEEELEISEDSIADIVSEVLADLSEEVKIDIADPLPKAGWSESKPALSGTEEYQEALESEIKRVKEATNENKELKAQNEKLNETLNKVHNVLKETATANARLLYTNKVLTNTSLNERQKIKIVEALSKAGSVEEAKIIFETLQSAVGTSANVKQPQSLSEAVTKSSSTYLPKTEKKQEKSSSATDRWKILAGL